MLDNRNWKGDPETLARLYNATQQGQLKDNKLKESMCVCLQVPDMADKNTPTKAKNFKGKNA